MSAVTTRAARWSAALIVLAFVARLDFILHPQQDWDTAWYLTLARSLASRGDLVVPWTGQANTYWPPLFPLFLAPLVKLLGPSYQTMVVGSTLATALLAAAVFFATRDLMGEPRAWAAAALVACNPVFLISDSLGMSESFVALWATLAAWAFLKSLQKPVWLAASVGFAALLYLSKATVGVPILALAVVAFLAWRVLARGLTKLDVALALVAAVGLGAAVALRGRLGGVGLGLLDPVTLAARDPTFVLLLAGKLLLAAFFLLVLTLPFSLLVGKAWRAPRSEGTGALWLAVLLVLATSAVFTATFELREGKPFFELDNVRYLAPALVPFLWILLPHAPFDADGAAGPRHERFLAGAVAALALLLLLSPLGGVASAGRVVAFALLALVPLALALAAAGSRQRLVARQGGAPRWERAPMRAWPGLLILLVGLALGFLVPVALVLCVGLCVALAAPSPQGRALVMGLAMLGAFTSNVLVGYPDEHAAAVVAEHKGLVTVASPAVYFGAVAPNGITMREADAPLPNSTAFVAFAPLDDANWTLAGSWPSDTHLPPGVRARFAIEEALGMPFLIDNATVLYVYVPR